MRMIMEQCQLPVRLARWPAGKLVSELKLLEDTLGY
jgi:hypothetical protein